MTRHSPLFLALIATAMALVGWNFGENSLEKPTPDSQPTSTRSARPERPARIRPGPTGEAAQRLEGIRTASNAADRMRATIALARSLPPAEFAKWLNAAWFTPRGGMEDFVFTRILMERWAKEAPEGLLVWGLKNESDEADTLLTTWAETEPQRLLDFFKNHPDDEKELDVLSEIASKHPELALRRLQEMLAAGISSQGTHMAGYVLRELAEESPAALEAVLDTLPSSLKLVAERYLIGQKMQDSFTAEFQKLLARPDGAELMVGILSDSDALKGKFVDELANLPASWRARIASDASDFISEETAAKWAAADLEEAGFSAVQANRIRLGTAFELSYNKPEDALKMLGELELESAKREGMLGKFFRHLRDKPEKAEPLLALLRSEQERDIARNAFQPPSSTLDPDVKKIEQPAEWLTTVAALNPEDGNSHEYLEMVTQWEPEKIAALSASFHSLPDDQKRKLAMIVGIGETNWKDPLSSEITAFFVTHPSEKANKSENIVVENVGLDPSQVITLATQYVIGLGQEQPEKAGEWIEALPDGEAKSYSTKNLHSVWSLYDPAAAERWFKSLPATLQTRVTSLK